MQPDFADAAGRADNEVLEASEAPVGGEGLGAPVSEPSRPCEGPLRGALAPEAGPARSPATGLGLGTERRRSAAGAVAWLLGGAGKR